MASKAENSRSGFSMLEVLAAPMITTFPFLALTPCVSQTSAPWALSEGAASLRVLGRLGDDLRHAIVWTGFGKIQDRGRDVCITVGGVLCKQYARLPNTRAAQCALHGG